MTAKRVFRRVSSWPWKQNKSRALILMYHSISNRPNDYFNLSVSPQNFADQCDYLQENCHVMSLSDLVEAVIFKRRITERSVVLTFDDGYLDFLLNAHPVLQAREIPATVFVVSGHLTNGLPFWWDRLEALLMNSNDSKESLSVTIQDYEHVYPIRRVEERLSCLAALHRLLLYCQSAERESIMTEIGQQLSLNNNELHHTPRPMIDSEIIMLSQSKLVEFGAHSVTHPLLTAMPDGILRSEISDCKQHLQDLLGTGIGTFAYPYGGLDDKTAELTGQTGYEGAVTISESPITNASDRFRLGRYGIGNWPHAEFKLRLETWFSESKTYAWS